MIINEIIEEYFEILKTYDEENSTTANWADLLLETINVIKKVIEITNRDNVNILSHLFALFYGGLIGNNMSTKSMNNDETHSLLKSLSDNILNSNESHSISEWLLQNRTDNKNICTKILERITSSMKNEQPSKVFFFRDAGLWITFQLSNCNISDYTHALLPIALNAADHHDRTISINGIKALSHISKHSFKADLRYYGQADIIYKTLESAIYSHDLEVFKLIIPCMLEFLKSFAPLPREGVFPMDHDLPYANGYDVLVVFLLHDLYLCSNADRRLVAIDHLDSICALMGTAFIRYMKSYLRTLETVILSPETRHAYPIAKEKMIDSLVRNVLPSVRPAERFFVDDLLRIMFAFVEECTQFAPTNHSGPLSPIVQATGELFQLLAVDYQWKLSSVYHGVKDILKNRDHFHFLRDLIVLSPGDRLE